MSGIFKHLLFSPADMAIHGDLLLEAWMDPGWILVNPGPSDCSRDPIVFANRNQSVAFVLNRCKPTTVLSERKSKRIWQKRKAQNVESLTKRCFHFFKFYGNFNLILMINSL